MGQLKTPSTGSEPGPTSPNQGEAGAGANSYITLGSHTVRLFLHAHLSETGAQGWGCVKGLAMFLSLYYIHFCGHQKVY